MTFFKSKWVTLLVVLSFAILQLIQPFIHAHLDAQHPIQNTGFHVGDAHENLAYHSSSITADANIAYDALSDFPHASHTLTVASGMTKPAELNLASSVSILILFAYVIALAVQPSLVLTVNHRNLPYKLLKRRLPASRSPPQA
jgi:hypothetical protein